MLGNDSSINCGHFSASTTDMVKCFVCTVCLLYHMKISLFQFLQKYFETDELTQVSTQKWKKENKSRDLGTTVATAFTGQIDIRIISATLTVGRNAKIPFKNNTSPQKGWLPNPMYMKSKPLINRLLQWQNLFHIKQTWPLFSTHLYTAIMFSIMILHLFIKYKRRIMPIRHCNLLVFSF